MKLAGKTVVITGASSGIGQATARVFAKEKANIVICYHKGKPDAESLVTELKKLEVKTLIHGGSLVDEVNVKELFKSTSSEFGSVDILVNLAGGAYEDGALPNTTRKHWHNVFDSNLISAVLCSQEAIKLMRKQASGGKIINTSSVLGEAYGGRPGVIAYSAAKAALINFTQTLAKQEAPKILVNAVAPGRTRTPYYDKFDDEMLETLKAANKIDRFINPEEIADAILFIASNDALVGELITVGGGYFL